MGEQGGDSGAEQHLSTSGQPEQTPPVHFRIHPDVTDRPVSCQTPSIQRASAGYFETIPGATLWKALPGSAFTLQPLTVSR